MTRESCSRSLLSWSLWQRFARGRTGQSPLPTEKSHMENLQGAADHHSQSSPKRDMAQARVSVPRNSCPHSSSLSILSTARPFRTTPRTCPKTTTEQLKAAQLSQIPTCLVRQAAPGTAFIPNFHSRLPPLPHQSPRWAAPHIPTDRRITRRASPVYLQLVPIARGNVCGNAAQFLLPLLPCAPVCSWHTPGQSASLDQLQT